MIHFYSKVALDTVQVACCSKLSRSDIKPRWLEVSFRYPNVILNTNLFYNKKQAVCIQQNIFYLVSIVFLPAFHRQRYNLLRCRQQFSDIFTIWILQSLCDCWNQGPNHRIAMKWMKWSISVLLLTFTNSYTFWTADPDLIWFPVCDSAWVVGVRQMAKLVIMGKKSQPPFGFEEAQLHWYCQKTWREESSLHARFCKRLQNERDLWCFLQKVNICVLSQSCLVTIGIMKNMSLLSPHIMLWQKNDALLLFPTAWRLSLGTKHWFRGSTYATTPTVAVLL